MTPSTFDFQLPPLPPGVEGYELRTAEDVEQEFKDRGFHYTPELIALATAHNQLNTRVLDLRCAHHSSAVWEAQLDDLRRREWQLAAALNPPTHAVGDVFDFRMFPYDDPLPVRLTDVSHFDLINGRVYRIEVIGRPDWHFPGAHDHQLKPPGAPNPEGDLIRAQWAVNAAQARINDIGPWRDLRSDYQRAAYQRAKLDAASAEREAHHLRKAHQPPPSPPPKVDPLAWLDSLPGDEDEPCLPEPAARPLARVLRSRDPWAEL